jgi:hypothetical protein
MPIATDAADGWRALRWGTSHTEPITATALADVILFDCALGAVDQSFAAPPTFPEFVDVID